MLYTGKYKDKCDKTGVMAKGVAFLRKSMYNPYYNVIIMYFLR